MGTNITDTNLLTSVKIGMNIWGYLELVQIFDTGAMQWLRWLGAGL